MSGPQAGPDQEAPQPPGGKRNRRWTWVTLAAIAAIGLACCGVSLVWVAGPLVVGTLTADQGEGSPGAALLAFVDTFADEPEAIGVERLIVVEQRKAIVAQRRATYSGTEVKPLRVTLASRKQTATHPA